MRFLAFLFAIAFCAQSSVYGVFNVITDGDDVLASPVMQNFRHVNYGNALKPVDSVGNATSNILDIGTNTAYWRDFYLAGTANVGAGLVVDTSTLFVNPVSNRVGIGTTAPATTLHVVGAATISSSLSSGAIDAAGNIQLSGSSPNLFGISLSDTFSYDGDSLANYGVSIFNDSGASPVAGTSVAISGYRGMRFFTSSSLAMSISGAGNVGIGRTTANVSLHVGPGGTGTVVDGALSSWTPQLFNSQSSGRAGVAAMVNDGANNRRAALFVDQTNAVWGLSGGYSSGAIPFVILNDPSELMRITAAGLVGIGSSNPGSKLNVAGNAAIGAGYATTAGPTNGLIIQGNVGIGTSNAGSFPLTVNRPSSSLPQVIFGRETQNGIFFNAQGGSGSYNWLIAQQNNVDTGLEFTPSNVVGGQTFSTPAFVLKPGKAGVAVNDPVNTLDVEGAVAVGASYSGTNTAPVNGMLVQGNVGIGTTSPSQALDVVGTVNASIGLVIDTNTLFVNGSSNMVGIGTTTPAQALDVVGSVTVSATVSANKLVAVSGIDSGSSGVFLKFKKVSIGVWNMDSTAGVLVSHGITGNDKIRMVQAWIRPDTFVSNNYFNLSQGFNAESTGLMEGAIVYFDDSNVSLQRRPSGVFDSTSFDDTGISRGFLLIWYE